MVTSTLDMVFVQLVLLILVVLYYINVSVYAYTFLCILLLVTLGVLLMMCGLGVYAYIILAAEIHVFYLITCFLLMWNRYDSIEIAAARSSNLLLSSRVLVIVVLSILYAIYTLSNVSLNYYGVDNYMIIMLLYGGENNYITASGTAAGLVNTLVVCYLTINSFEFLIINIYMLLAVFIYYHVVAVYKYNVRLLQTINIYRINRVFKFNLNYSRSIPQARQLTRCTSIYNNGRVTK